PARVVDGAQQAFVYALHYGLLLGSGVALLGALTAFVLIRKRSEEQIEAQAGDVEAHAPASPTAGEASGAEREPAAGAEPESRQREPETVHV
ncbi:MAG TPA: hypothetical protein VN817_08245, partial [Solirubrobacteraceae bacterium]|nr:hypothetical protein [Solirubrobacteraceae bacterium]